MTDSKTTTALPTLLHTDSRGRVRTPPEARAALLDTFEQSGMSGAAFARLHGIKYQTFAYWRQQRRRTQPDMDDSTACSLFAEVEVRESQAVGLRLALPGGASLQLDRADQFPLAAALLRYLEQV